MKKLLMLLPIILAIAPLAAGWDLPRPNLNPYSGNNNSLLSMDRVSMSHSMGFEAGTSSIGDGYYMSRYTNHIMYKFNPKLELDLDLNFVNFGSVDTSRKLSFNDDNNNRIIPEFTLRYKPSDSVLIQVNMSQGSLVRPYRQSLADTW